MIHANTTDIIRMFRDWHCRDCDPENSEYCRGQCEERNAYDKAIEALEKQNQNGTGLHLDIPISIGDPVLVIEYNQHDGYYLGTRQFNYNLIEAFLNGRAFTSIKDAEAVLAKLMENNE